LRVVEALMAAEDTMEVQATGESKTMRPPAAVMTA
jgi:hypothetical protein